VALFLKDENVITRQTYVQIQNLITKLHFPYKKALYNRSHILKYECVQLFSNAFNHASKFRIPSTTANLRGYYSLRFGLVSSPWLDKSSFMKGLRTSAERIGGMVRGFGCAKENH